MTDAIDPGSVRIPLEAVPADQIVEGEPRTGAVPLGDIGGAEYGVWEMTPGVMDDVEVDEMFLVLSGRARIEFPDGSRPALEAGPGDLCRLASGDRTRWTVEGEPIRKLYLA